MEKSLNPGSVLGGNQHAAGALALAFTTASIPAQAATTDWMKPSEASRFARSLEGGDALFAVQCKDSGKSGKVNDMTLVRLTYKAARESGLEWSWGVGDRTWFKKASATRAAEGFRRVSYGSFTRKASGILVQCAVWQK